MWTSAETGVPAAYPSPKKKLPDKKCKETTWFIASEFPRGECHVFLHTYFSDKRSCCVSVGLTDLRRPLKMRLSSLREELTPFGRPSSLLNGGIFAQIHFRFLHPRSLIKGWCVWERCAVCVGSFGANRNVDTQFFRCYLE